MHDKTFPNESSDYRTARNFLLEAERALRRQTEAVAALRRQLPPGGRLPQDYAFQAQVNGRPRTIRMSQLFRPGCDSLIVYHLMYSLDMAEPCPLCASFIDSLDRTLPHYLQRGNLVVLAKSPIERLVGLAAQRDWTHLPLLSSLGTPYARDYHAESEGGGQDPMLNVFRRQGDAIHHAWGSELLLLPPDPGQNHRHLDSVWPLYNLFDLTPDGRPEWYPQLAY